MFNHLKKSLYNPTLSVFTTTLSNSSQQRGKKIDSDDTVYSVAVQNFSLSV